MKQLLLPFSKESPGLVATSPAKQSFTTVSGELISFFVEVITARSTSWVFKMGDDRFGQKLCCYVTEKPKP